MGNSNSEDCQREMESTLSNSNNIRKRLDNLRRRFSKSKSKSISKSAGTLKCVAISIPKVGSRSQSKIERERETETETETESQMQTQSNAVSDCERENECDAKLENYFSAKLMKDVTVENFMTKFEQMQKSMVSSNDLCLDNCAIPKNRVIFVSTLGLYQSWQYVPSCVLKDCILLLQCKRDWVYNSNKYLNNNDSIITLIGAENDNNFLTMLKYKDSQNLVFWMYDNLTDWANKFENEIETAYQRYKHLRQSSKNGKNLNFNGNDFKQLQSLRKQLKTSHNRFDKNHSACAFWRYFSIKLSEINDPISGNNFLPLIIDERWWQNEYNYGLSTCTQYGCMPEQVINQLKGVLQPKYKTVMELIYQSNPSLLLVTNYRQLGSEIRGIRGLLTSMFENLNGDALLCDPIKHHNDNCVANTNTGKNGNNENDNKECITPESNENSKNSKNDTCHTGRHSMSTLKTEDLAHVLVDAQWDKNNGNLSTWMSIDYNPFDVECIDCDCNNDCNYNNCHCQCHCDDNCSCHDNDNDDSNESNSDLDSNVITSDDNSDIICNLPSKKQTL